MFHRSEPSASRNAVVSGFTVTAPDAGRKLEGREAFIASVASSAKSEAEAYRAVNATCMESVNFVPTPPGGGSYFSERVWVFSIVFSKRKSPESSSSTTSRRVPSDARRVQRRGRCGRVRSDGARRPRHQGPLAGKIQL